jgi:hypothetical protein
MKDQDLAFTSILGDATRIYLARFARFAGIALLAHVPVLVLTFLEALVTTDDGDATAQQLLSRLTTAASTIAVAITSAYLVPSVVAALGGAATPRDVGPRVMSALGTAWVSNLVIGLGLLCFIVPGVFAAMYYCVAIPAAVVEGMRSGQALQRSAALTEGRRVLVLLVFLAYALAFVSLVSISFVPIIGLVASAAASGVPMDSMTIAFLSVPTIVVSALASAFGSCLFAVLYVRLREDKDGVDAASIAAVFA